MVQKFTCRAERGATLIEVLVAIVILSVGLLGTAGLLVNSMRAVSEQGNFSGASIYARELGERMMGNPSVAFRATNNPYLFTGATGSWPSAGGANCRNNFCTALQRAQWDAAEWSKRVDTAGATGNHATPGVRVRVCLDSLTANSGTAAQWTCTPSANPVAAIKVAWASRDSTGRVENTGAGNPTPRATLVVVPGADPAAP